MSPWSYQHHLKINPINRVHRLVLLRSSMYCGRVLSPTYLSLAKEIINLGEKTLNSLTSSTSSSSVLSINIFFPTELVPEAGRLLLETTGVTVSLRFVRALMHQPAPRDNVYPKTVSQFPVRLLSFHQPGQIRVGLSGFFVGPACEQRFAGGHFEYSLTSR